MEKGVIPESTQHQIRQYMRTFMLKALEAIRPVSAAPHEFRFTRDEDEDATIKPFHEALITEGVLRASDFERSFSTSLGSTFEEAAKLIGSLHFQTSERGHKFSVTIPRVALDTIDGIISDIASDGMQGRYEEFVDAVVQAYRGDLVTRRPLTIDLYLRSQDGAEYFFEMKSPKPNKDGAVGAVRKLLTIHGVKGAGPPRVLTYYSMAYNPYGVERASYGESVAGKYLDIQEMVLIGKQFWDFLGGEGTYEELLNIYRQVGQELGLAVWQKITGPA